MSDLLQMFSKPTEKEVLQDGGSPMSDNNALGIAFHKLVSISETEWNVTFGHRDNPTATILHFGDPKTLGYMRNVRGIFNLMSGMRGGWYPVITATYISHLSVLELTSKVQYKHFAYALDTFNGVFADGDMTLDKLLPVPDKGYFAVYNKDIGNEHKMEQHSIASLQFVTDPKDFWLCSFAKLAAASVFAQGYSLNVFLSNDALQRWDTCKAVLSEEDDAKAQQMSNENIVGSIVSQQSFDDVGNDVRNGFDDATVDLSKLELTIHGGGVVKASEIQNGERIVRFIRGTNIPVGPRNGTVQVIPSPYHVRNMVEDAKMYDIVRLPALQ